MSVNVLYTTSATATGGRDGRGVSKDAGLDLKFARPPGLGGKGDGVNPEQLFALGYSACFLSALQFVASQGSGPKVPADAQVSATVGIGPRSEGGFGLTVALAVKLPGLERAVATDLVRRAHEVCPYSNATRNNIDVQLSVQDT